VAVTSVPTDVQINYVAGGGAANLPVRVSAMVRGKSLSFSDYDAFSFNPPRAAGRRRRQAAQPIPRATKTSTAPATPA
jgi:hypothetical protein